MTDYMYLSVCVCVLGLRAWNVLVKLGSCNLAELLTSELLEVTLPWLLCVCPLQRDCYPLHNNTNLAWLQLMLV